MYKINFKEWDEIKDKIGYHNSDNILFSMENVAQLSLICKRRDDTSPKMMSLIMGNSSIRKEIYFTEENYTSVCELIQTEYDSYIEKVINSYRTEPIIFVD